MVILFRGLTGSWSLGEQKCFLCLVRIRVYVEFCPEDDALPVNKREFTRGGCKVSSHVAYGLSSDTASILPFCMHRNIYVYGVQCYCEYLVSNSLPLAQIPSHNSRNWFLALACDISCISCAKSATFNHAVVQQQPILPFPSSESGIKDSVTYPWSNF